MSDLESEPKRLTELSPETGSEPDDLGLNYGRDILLSMTTTRT